MLGLTRKDWLQLLPIFLIFAFVSTFRAGAAGLIDPDEPFYALTAKEMLQHREWLTPMLFGQPQFEKPVFAYWVYLALFKLFGIREWSARLGPALAALGTLAACAVMARALFRRMGTTRLSTVVLASAGLFIALSRIVLTDMFLCFFTTAAFAAFAYGWKNGDSRTPAWRFFFAFMGLGFLTKGPLGILLPLGCVLIFSGISGLRLARHLPWKSGLLLLTAVSAPWYVVMAARYDWFAPHFFLHENVRRFFVAEHASMNTPFFYPVVIGTGFFPWSALLVCALAAQCARLGRGGPESRASRQFLLVSSAAMFVFFSSASSKLISYIFPLFPLLAILVGDWLERMIRLYRRPGARVSGSMQMAAIAGWGILPAVLVGGVAWYEHDHALGLRNPVLEAGLFCIIPCAASAVLLIKRRLAAACVCAAAMAAVFSMAAFGWILPKTERFFSSRAILHDFEQDGFDPSKGTLLASKISVRGVSYYSGNPNVAVVSTNSKRTFYTPHPILMIEETGDLSKVASDHYPIYGILRPKEIRRLDEITAGGYDLRILDANAQRSIVRLERREF